MLACHASGPRFIVHFVSQEGIVSEQDPLAVDGMALPAARVISLFHRISYRTGLLTGPVTSISMNGPEFLAQVLRLASSIICEQD